MKFQSCMLALLVSTNSALVRVVCVEHNLWLQAIGFVEGHHTTSANDAGDHLEHGHDCTGQGDADFMNTASQLKLELGQGWVSAVANLHDSAICTEFTRGHHAGDLAGYLLSRHACAQLQVFLI